MNTWYLLRTKTAAEAKAQLELAKQGYLSYLPQYSQRIRRNGRRLRIIAPLFPRYLFVQLQLGLQALTPIKSTRGVVSIVRFGEDYAQVPTHVIDGLHMRADHSGMHPLGEQQMRHKAPVRILEGPFQGLEGVFLETCAENRVSILLNLLGRETRVSLEEHLVSAVA